MSDSVLVNGEPIGGGGGGIVSVVGTASATLEAGELLIVDTGLTDHSLGGDVIYPFVRLFGPEAPADSKPFVWAGTGADGDIDTVLQWVPGATLGDSGEWKVLVTNNADGFATKVEVVVARVSVPDDASTLSSTIY